MSGINVSSIETSRVGMRFTTIEDVSTFMDEWMESVSILFTRGRTEKLRGHEKNFALVKYRSVEYTCKHGGTPYRRAGTDQRERE